MDDSEIVAYNTFAQAQHELARGRLTLKNLQQAHESLDHAYRSTLDRLSRVEASRDDLKGTLEARDARMQALEHDLRSEHVRANGAHQEAVRHWNALVASDAHKVALEAKVKALQDENAALQAHLTKEREESQRYIDAYIKVDHELRTLKAQNPPPSPAYRTMRAGIQNAIAYTYAKEPVMNSYPMSIHTILTADEAERLAPFLYHTVDDVTATLMADIRAQYLSLAVRIIREQDQSRPQSIALTQLEEALMRTIQGMALQGTPQVPPGFAIENAAVHTAQAEAV